MKNRIMLKSLKNSKKMEITNIVFIILITILVMTCFTFYKVLNNYIDDNLYQNIKCRTFFLHYNPSENEEEVLEKVRQIEHVTLALKYDDYRATGVSIDDFKTEKANGYVDLYTATEETTPKVIRGEFLKKGNYLVCPDNILASNDGFYTSIATKDDLLNLNDYLGKKINLNYKTYYYEKENKKYEEYNVQYEIIGLYSSKNAFAEYNVCYTNHENIKTINSVINKDNDIFNDGKVMPAVIVDNADNLEYVLSQVRKMGYNYQIRVTFDDILIDLLNYAVIFLLTLTLVIAFVLINIYFKKIINFNLDNIATLKALGYSNSKIIKIVIMNFISKSLIAYIIGLLIYSIIFIFIKYALNNANLIFSVFDLIIPYSMILVIILCISVIILVQVWFLKRRILKLSTIKIFSE